MLERIYRKLSSTRTSVYILLLTALCYLVGTIFPQGADLDAYKEAGGGFVLLVRVFDLLGFFTSPLFLVLVAVLFANLVICTWERWKALRVPARMPSTHEPTHTLTLTQDITDAKIDARKAFREALGFKVVSSYDNHWATLEKGVPWRWLTWAYHAAFVVCFLGFLLTILFAWEDIVTLWPNEPVNVRPAEGGRVAELMGREPPESGFQIVLDEFRTTYVEVPELQYPEDAASRLAVGLGWNRPEYRLTGDSISASDWLSDLRVLELASTVREKTIEVNEPLKHGGYTFYQIGYDSRYRLRVNDYPIPLEAEANEDVIVPGTGTAIRLGYVRAGELTRLDGSVERLVPSVPVERVEVDGETGETVTTELGRLEYGTPMMINGTAVTLAGYEEGTVLSYRYDPGVGLLWWAGIFILVVMAVRFYGSWYRVSYTVDESDGLVILYMDITSRGVASDPDKIARRVEYFLTRDEIRPTPLD